eukprot:TRINITY_DN39575_c0_g1_i1.p1 TRINITY_DN39575_c0_g1~~TRINITY_DN39575_c0_g1_i1.p1  ORF type:complete len:230 (+),score=18.50 TRINITY_DN39575_c0_g1_i1:75-692(+)
MVRFVPARQPDRTLGNEPLAGSTNDASSSSSSLPQQHNGSKLGDVTKTKRKASVHDVSDGTCKEAKETSSDSDDESGHHRISSVGGRPNNWENCRLSNPQEKSKFLRLMGGKVEPSLSGTAEVVRPESVAQARCHLHAKQKRGCKFCDRFTEVSSKFQQEVAARNKALESAAREHSSHRERERELECQYRRAAIRGTSRGGLGAT